MANTGGSVNADSIIQKVEQANRNRDLALQSYTAMRTYRADGKRPEARLLAQVEFQSPDSKQFTVVSEEGSGLIRRSVFRGMMAAEAEALRPDRKRLTALSRENYLFTLQEQGVLGGRACYILGVEPRREEKFLFRGRIWVDAQDYAVSRIEGQPARMPSFWTRRINFIREFQKVGDFWLPARDESVTQVRLVGEKTVTIEHSDYKLESLSLRASAGARRRGSD